MDILCVFLGFKFGMSEKDFDQAGKEVRRRMLLLPRQILLYILQYQLETMALCTASSNPKGIIQQNPPPTITMGVLYFLDDLGNALLCRPMSKAHKFRFLNFFDDMGIFFVCKPMGYLYRFAEVLVG